MPFVARGQSKKLCGVFVAPEYFQNETIDAVLDRLAAAGVNAITTSPYVMEPADEKTGAREPPGDAGAGSVRLLDRPLWGKRELFVTTAPSFEPDERLYRGLKYQPSKPNAITRQHGAIIDRVIRGCQARHLKVYLQVMAVIPPGYRVQFGGADEEDLPKMPNGAVPANRVSKNASLASEHIRAYGRAMLTDLCRRYADVDGIRVDWPEYPPYSLDDCFVDFSLAAEEAAERLGYDFEAMKRDAAALQARLLGKLTNEDLAGWLEPGGGRFLLASAARDYPGVAQWLAFKAQLVDELLSGHRTTIESAGDGRIELVAHAFPPPFSLVSGIDFGRSARHVAAYLVKLYTMHWPMMLRFYGDKIAAANPQVDRALLGRALTAWFDIADDGGLGSLDAYHYPEPEEPHPAGKRAQVRKLRLAQQAAGQTPVLPLVHGYGPNDDFRGRLELAWGATPYGLWINRYSYLRDEKIDIIGQVCGE